MNVDFKMSFGKEKSVEKTMLVLWKPSKTSCTMERFDEILADWTDGWTPEEIEWHVGKNEQARKGDWLYIVDTESVVQGVAMVGQVTDYDKKTGIASIELKAMFHPDRSPMLTTDELKAHLKGVDWCDKSPLKSLTEKQSERLGKIWRAFIANNRDVFKPRAAICEEWLEEQQQASLIDKAIALAVEAHSSDIDLDGNPTILHALSVGMAGKSDNEKIVGFLHDVVEDTEYTFDDIAAEGFDEETMEALHLLTHDKVTPYMEYIAKICDSGNKTAINVKLNDLHHNLKRGKEGGHLQFASKHNTAVDYINDFLSKEKK